MIKSDFSSSGRLPKEVALNADLVVTGGGMAGVCAAITAARRNLKVILVQDRPVLGGNASSEVRLWILGATSSMGNNNRWAREGGVLNEILVENMYRNPDGNAIIFDTILLEKVTAESNITLLLNTAAYEVVKSTADEIEKITAFCSQNSTKYVLSAPFFCDASGDEIVAFQAGAAFRMGAEAKEEFDEGFAPDEEYGHLLGHSIYFYSKDAGRPISYTAPSYALKDVSNIIKYRSFNIDDHGCQLWWIEYGGRLDTIHQSEDIKWELWRVIYGIWDHIKNSGKYPEAENLTLEWVGTIPGKRESRRFEGDYILSQKDVIEQREHIDAVAYGGWALDLHPADGVFSDRPGCNQWHSKGIYQIPIRTLYSKNIKNLWLAGRIISSSHVAFGSSRVMATVAACAQVVGYGTAYCLKNSLLPRDIVNPESIKPFQQELLQEGEYIPGIRPEIQNLAHRATITASSELKLGAISFDGEWQKLVYSTAQLIPLTPVDDLNVTLQIDAKEDTNIRVELRTSKKPQNFTPEIVLASQEVTVDTGFNEITVNFNQTVPKEQYAFICIQKNDAVAVKTSKMFLTGTMMVTNRFNKAVATSGVQSPPDGIGVDTFEFWCPSRRPKPQNIGMTIYPAIIAYECTNVINGTFRPTTKANAWVADLNDKSPSLQLKWDRKVEINEMKLFFDSDFDHPLESTLRIHPERVVPHTVRDYYLVDEAENVLYKKEGNYQTINHIKFDKTVNTNSITIYLTHPSENVPAALFEVQIF